MVQGEREQTIVLKLNFPAALHCMSVLKLFQLLIINFIMLFIEGRTRFNWWVWLVPVRHLEKLEAMVLTYLR